MVLQGAEEAIVDLWGGMLSSDLPFPSKSKQLFNSWVLPLR